MDDQIVALYCLCDDVLKALDHAEDPQHQMSDAELNPVEQTRIKSPVAGIHEITQTDVVFQAASVLF